MAVQDGGIEGHMLIFSCKNSKITTCCWTTINRRMLDPIKKQKTKPYPEGQSRSSSNTVGGSKWHLESNSILTRDTCRAQIKNLVHNGRPHRHWARPAFECIIVSCRGTGQQWLATGAGALDAAVFGVALSPLGGGQLNPTIEPLSRWPTNCRTIIPKKFSQC